jgi:hypothetical protein
MGLKEAKDIAYQVIGRDIAKNFGPVMNYDVSFYKPQTRAKFPWFVTRI